MRAASQHLAFLMQRVDPLQIRSLFLVFFLSIPPPCQNSTHFLSFSSLQLLPNSSSYSHSLSPSPSPSRLGCFRLERSLFHAFDRGSTRRGARISSGVGR